jgi:hypothetical protein
MIYRVGQKLIITNEVRECAPYNKFNGKIVKILGKNTFLGLYYVELDGQEWALHEEGFKEVKNDRKCICK